MSGDVHMVLRFRYVNWRGVDHEYVVQVEGSTLGIEFRDGRPPRDPNTLFLHGEVITRDGDRRPEMGPTRRRSFEWDKLRAVSIVGEAA